MQGARFTRQAYYAFITSRQTGEMQCAAKHTQKSRKPQGVECNRPHLLLNKKKTLNISVSTEHVILKEGRKKRTQLCLSQFAQQF